MSKPVGLLLLLAAGWLLFWFGLGRNVAALLQWSETEAVLVRADMTLLPPSTEGPVRPEYSLLRACEYTYDVAGREYRGDRIGFWIGEKEVHPGVYALGRKIPVYYDSGHPGRAVLFRGFDFASGFRVFGYILGAAGAFTVVLVLVIAPLISFRRWRAKRSLLRP